MQILVLADEVAKEELMLKEINADTKITFVKELSEIFNVDQFDVFCILKEEMLQQDLTIYKNKPVFINSTIFTLDELNLPENFIRISGWATFLNREIWEVATVNENIVKHIFNSLGWKYIAVKDGPGLVAARIICMIINEAYFALGDNVSSKEEIDIAMKLGTNYPFGPFEWSKKIGLKNIYNLLEKLSKTDTRYNIAPAIKDELFTD